MDEKLYRALVYLGFAFVLLAQSGILSGIELRLGILGYGLMGAVAYLESLYHKFKDSYIAQGQLTEWDGQE